MSYPRSGNTLATRLTAKATQGQVFSAMTEGYAPFSKRIYPKNYPLPRLIKDHVAHLHYRNDRCVLVVRDGRDTVISLAFMTLQNRLHRFADKSELADFIRWVVPVLCLRRLGHARKEFDAAPHGPRQTLGPI